MNIVQSIFMIILSVEFLIGNIGNGFIALVNIRDWVKRRQISVVDQILTALAISRIVLLWISDVSMFLAVLSPIFLKSVVMFTAIKVPWTVANHFSIWLATSLSIVYFLKIANFSNAVFLYLKWRVETVVSVTLMVSMVLLLVNVILLSMHHVICVDGCKGNFSHNSSLRSSAQLSKFVLLTYTVFFFMPFTMSLATFLLLIFSLWKHLKNMQYNVKGSRDPSTTAHMKAIQTVVTFLLLYTIFFLSQVVQLWNFKFSEKSLMTLLCQTVGLAFPSAHSCVLILGNAKLRQAAVCMLWWLGYGSKDTRPSDL